MSWWVMDRIALYMLVLFAGYVVLQAKGWTGPELKAAIDKLFRLDGEKRRELQEHSRRIGALRADLDEHGGDILDLKGRVFRIEGIVKPSSRADLEG